MYALSSIPFLRFTLFLALGIGVSLFSLNQPIPVSVHMVAFSVFAILWLYFYKIQLQFAKDIRTSILISLGFFYAGFVLANTAQSKFKSDFFETVKSKSNIRFLHLRLTDEISEKPNTWRCPAQVSGITDSVGNTFQTTGNVLVYWPKASNTQKPSLAYGDELIIPDIVLPMPSAAFPEGFDFKAVMRYKDIQHQVFLREKAWVKTGNSAHLIFTWAFEVKNATRRLLNRMYAPPVAALLTSLLIGDKEAVDPENLKAFAISGTMHVLAVSGMHVGLLYMVLLFLFSGKTRVTQHPRWRGVIILTVLWGFAMVTGMSASVLRAVWMFTIMESGRTFFDRKGNILNSLFAAAFLQLLTDPLQLIDVGFQLSYLAVLGIVVVYPRLNALWSPANSVLRLVYQSGLVSLAATIATFPVSLYFFGAFPVWFLPANILIVPLSTLVIIAALLSVIFSWTGPVASGIQAVTTWLTELLNQVTSFFSKLPFATADGLRPDVAGTFLLLFAVLMGTLFWVFRVKRALWISAASLAVLFAWNLADRYLDQRRSEIICCELRGRMLAVSKSAGELYVISGPLNRAGADSLLTFMSDYIHAHHISKVNWMLTDGEFFRHENVKIHRTFPVSRLTNVNNEWSFDLYWTRPSVNEHSEEKTLCVIQKRNVGRYALKSNSIVLRNNYYRFRYP